VKAACSAVECKIKTGDIPKILSRHDQKLGRHSYIENPRGDEWILDGVKVLGVDIGGFDLPFADMASEYASSGSTGGILEAHFVGIEREFCRIEKFCKLGEIPRPHGFKVAVLPIKIERGSGGWFPAVAFA
jgi:kynurenine formamidase